MQHKTTETHTTNTGYKHWYPPDKTPFVKTPNDGTQQSEIKASAKGKLRHGTIGGVSYLSKSGSKTSMLVSNELSGYNMIRKKIDAQSKDAPGALSPDIIPQNMYLNPNDHEMLYVQSAGNMDIQEWIEAIKGQNTDMWDISKIQASVQTIITQLQSFVAFINCGTNKVYHCDLHPENIRLTTGMTDVMDVVKIHVIDFDTTRAGRCDEFRSSTKKFGLQKLSGDTLNHVVTKTVNFISGKTGNLPDRRTRTDWAFFHSISALLYEFLAHISNNASLASNIQDGCDGIKFTLQNVP
jgi:hypothetical protein